MYGSTGASGSDPLGGWRTPEQREAEAQAAKSRKMRIGLFSIGAVLLLVGGMVINPPTGSVHSFTEASNYNSDRESGCVNSGEGCHGEETKFTDFNAYHPDAKCTTCHDYQGAACIPCHSPKEHECSTCHDGTMEAAPDRVRITDPYPRGHYRESTHTALGTDFKAVVRAAEEGKAKASCKSCHSKDLRAAHDKVPQVAKSEYGESIGCGECHNDSRSNGLTQVKANWKQHRCEDCHTEKSSSPLHDIEIASVVRESKTGPGCGTTGDGCHGTTDLHATHANKPKDCSGSAAEGEPACHDLERQADKPTGKTCGGDGEKTCHDGYENDMLAHKHDADVHSPTTVVPANDTTFFETACGDCHNMTPDGTSLVDEHVLPTSAGRERPCTGCHNSAASAAAIADSWPERNTTGACDACHGANGLDGAHARDIVEVHDASGSTGCADTGSGCHAGADLSAVGTPEEGGLHESCLRCHDRNASGDNLSYNPSRKTCGAGRDCHNSSGAYSPITQVHTGGGHRVDGNDPGHTAGSAQHDATWNDPVSGSSTPCSTCHRMALSSEHGRDTADMSGSGTPCVRCHSANDSAALVVKTGWEARTTASACVACHNDTAAPANHKGIDTAHAGTALDASGTVKPTACLNAGCHATLDLRALHKTDGCGTEGCHSATGPITGLGIVSCGGTNPERSCHAGYAKSGFNHKHDRELHSPTTSTPSADTSYYATACGACHDMRPNGTSLADEHALATSKGHEGGCTGCHGNAASVSVIASSWPERDTTASCAACHGRLGLPAAHERPIAEAHATTSTACADTGAGCHGGHDLSVVGAPVDGGVHATCLRCHDRTASSPNLAFDPDKRSCGAGRDCHAISGSYEPTSQVHAAGPTRRDGTDASHTAGIAQAMTPWVDSATGRSLACSVCHGAVLLTEHSRPNVTMGGSGSTCVRCHSASSGTAHVVKTGWTARATSAACAACHDGSAAPGIHGEVDSVHVANQIDQWGAQLAGTCATAGCHLTSDVRAIHKVKGCTIDGCHSASGDIRGLNRLSCGGPSNSTTTCHPGYGAGQHFVDHSANLVGSVNGVLYDTARNVGCFGCHTTNLMTEHSAALIAGSMEGGASGPCRVCHYNASDPGSGRYSTSTSVLNAIAGRDHRCVSCHNSGDANDSAAAVASPHKVFSTESTLTGGAVWTDPMGDWEAAFDSVTGGGHNPPPSLIAGAVQKFFPIESFVISGTVYNWVLPSNAVSTTAWINTTRYPEATSTAYMRTMTVECSDCHVLDNPSGPQGAQVQISIDPNYAQTEYSNPTSGTYQFDPFNVDSVNPDNPPGYKPVICVKCHMVYAQSIPGTTTVRVGGHSIHNTHRSRHWDADSGQREQCSFCHLRIPHAWKRPRLLARTASGANTTFTPDAFPYVSKNYKGLTGIRLVDLNTPSKLTRDLCGTGGCYSGSSTAASHPLPSQIPTASYWP